MDLNYEENLNEYIYIYATELTYALLIGFYIDIIWHIMIYNRFGM